MNAVMTYEKEAIFILEHWDHAKKIYDHEGWCDFIAWNNSKKRAIAMWDGKELVAVGFFWQLDDPDVDWSDHFPEETSFGRYLYCPFAVIKPGFRGGSVWRQMVKLAVGMVDSPFLKYLSYHRIVRKGRIKTMKLEDVFK